MSAVKRVNRNHGGDRSVPSLEDPVSPILFADENVKPFTPGRYEAVEELHFCDASTDLDSSFAAPNEDMIERLRLEEIENETEEARVVAAAEAAANAVAAMNAKTRERLRLEEAEEAKEARVVAAAEAEATAKADAAVTAEAAAKTSPVTAAISEERSADPNANAPSVTNAPATAFNCTDTETDEAKIKFDEAKIEIDETKVTEAEAELILQHAICNVAAATEEVPSPMKDSAEEKEEMLSSIGANFEEAYPQEEKNPQEDAYPRFSKDHCLHSMTPEPVQERVLEEIEETFTCAVCIVS